MSIPIAIAVMLLFAPGILPMVALGQQPAGVIVTAPLMSAGLAAIAGVAAVATRAPLLPWFALVVVVANVLALRALREGGPLRVPSISTVAAVIVVVCSAAPLTALVTADAGWDARSIWLLHARWFFGGGAYVWDALGERALLFSHPDYPPLVPATVALTWRLLRDVDVRVGQVVISCLNAAAIGTCALGLSRCVRGHGEQVAAVVAGAAALAAWGIAGIYGFNGYADLLWAAAAAAAVIHLCVLPLVPGHAAVGFLAAMVAALVKNEALPVVVVAVLVAVVRWRGARVAVVGAMLTLATILAWPIEARLAGARGDLVGGGLAAGAPAAPEGESRADRVEPAVRSVRTWLADPFVPAAVCAVAGLVALRRTRRELGLGGWWWTWATVAVGATSLVVAYVISPYDLGWHMGTSLDRTSIGPRLLLVVELAVWACCAVAAVAQRRRRATTMPSWSNTSRKSVRNSESNSD